jgi:hypothetical protein
MPAEELSADDFAALSAQEERSIRPPREVTGDAALLVRFYEKAYRVTKDELVDGKLVPRICFEKRERVAIRVPGDKTLEAHHDVNDAIRARFPRQYAAWKAGAEQETAGGWPLEKWPELDVAQVEELRARGVRTVEQLAGMSDANLGKLGPGWRAVRQAAQDFLEAAKSSAPLTRLREENETLKSQVEAMQRQMAEQAKVLLDMQKANKKERAA